MLGTQVYGLAQAKQVGRRNFVGKARGAFRQALHKATALCLIAGLSVPALPAPEAQASAMALLGTLDISKTGAATYGLDISVPPGTGGMIPSLSLQYNSQAGNSTLGMGWSVAGLSGVSRCPKNLATDGERGAVNFDGDDRFCLEGQHLIVVSGTYGADGAEYRTEVEGFSRIYSHGTAGNGPAWFEVQTKSGQTMEYGNTVDSRALAQGTTTARVWAVNKIEDTVGNYLTYSYVNDTANGQLYPTRIDYTANDSEGLSAYNSVRFSYETRPDIVPLYLGGSLMKSTTRLTNVKTYVGEAVVADYQMTYEQSPATGRSRLTDLDLCTGAGACLPGIDFEYSGIAFTSGSTDNGTLHLDPSSTDGTYDSSFIFPVELNGDGKTDLIIAPYDAGGVKGQTVNIWMSTATTAADTNLFTVSDSTQAMQDNYAPYPGDYNGDGLTDILSISADELSYDWFSGNGTLENNRLLGCTLRSSNGDGTFSSKGGGTNVSWGETTITACSDGFPWSITWSNHPENNPELTFFDFNGDGLLDLFSSSENVLYYGVRAGTVSGVLESVTPHISTYLNEHHQNFLPSGDTRSGDFNGDGLGDLLWVGYDLRSQDNGDGTYTIVDPSTPVTEDTHTVWLSKGDTHFKGYGHLADGEYIDANASIGDFNGDGLSDILWVHDDYRDLWFSKGDGSFEVVENLEGADNSFVDYVARLADFNGDGLSDIFWVHEDKNHRRLWISKGDGSFDVVNDFGYFSVGGPTNIYNLNHDLGDEVYLSDFNGDGKSDVLLARVKSTGLLKNDRALWLSKNEVPDLLVKVTSGLGPITELVYLPLTDGRVYTKDTDATYPLIDIQSASQVIYQVDADNGAGGIHSVVYHYTGAKGTYDGRGWLGFREVSIEDLDNNIVQTTTYSQAYPLTGMTLSQTKSLNGQVLNSSLNTYEATNLGVESTRYFIGLASSVVESWDLDGSSVPPTTTTYVYDDYGNATTVTVSTPDDASRVTSNIYVNDISNWYLGRLTSASVSSTLDMIVPTVTSTNPVAVTDDIETLEDTAVTFSPLSNDIGIGLSITQITQGSLGTAVLDANGNDVVYTPNANVSGVDTLMYSVVDTAGKTVSGTLYVTILAVGDAPIALNDLFTVDAGSAVILDLLLNDVDVEGAGLQITSVSQGSLGSVAIDVGGLTVTYTANGSVSGTDSFSYTITDGNSVTATAIVSITVQSVAAAPTAVADTGSVNEDASVTIYPLDNDTDANGDVLTVSSITQGGHGSVSILSSGLGVVYTPAADFNGSDSFSYTVGDGTGLSDTGSVGVTVNAINDGPSAIADVIALDRATSITFSPLDNDVDVDGDVLTIVSIAQPTNGVASIDASGTSITLVASSSYSGTDTMTYTIEDPSGVFATATVDVTYNPVVALVRDSAGVVQAPYTEFSLILEYSPHFNLYRTYDESNQTIYYSHAVEGSAAGFCNPSATTIAPGYSFTGNGCEFVYSP